MKRVSTLGLLAFLAASSATSARADQKAACLEAASQGQTLRDAHKLLDAQAQLRICASEACPAVVQRDCARWLESVGGRISTVVLSAKNGAGADLFDVKVSVDQTLLAARLDGQTVSLDPGPHHFHFELPDGTHVDKDVLVKEGQKNQLVEAVLGNPSVAVTRTTAAVAPTALRIPSGASPLRTWAWVAGGAGVLGIGLGATFGLLASSAWTNAKSACGGNTAQCANVASATSYRSTTVMDGAVSTVGFIAGGVFVATAAVLFLAGSRHDDRPTTGVRVVPSVGPGMAGLSFAGGF